jgi:hypothetical protein
MAQGFVRTNNLAESLTPSSDRNILDNLGGVNITQDVLLFDGNANFESKLINDSSTSRADFSLFDDATESNFKTVKTDLINNKRAFSNGTKLSFDNGNTFPFIVVDSNGLDEFRVVATTATITYNAGDYSGPFSGLDITNLTMTRSDTITVQNIENMSVDRLPTVDVQSDSEEIGTGGADSSDDTGDIDIATEEGAGIYDNYGTYDQISYVAGAIGRLEAKKQRTVLTDRLSFFEERVRFKGNVRITNDAQTTIFQNSANAPGLFVYNTASNSEIRAFSGSDNPWAENSSIAIDDGSGTLAGLQTSSLKSQVSNLVFSPDNGGTAGTANDRGDRPAFVKKNTSGAVVGSVTHIDGSASASSQLTVAGFTHKIPITVNGEQFFMLATKV